MRRCWHTFCYYVVGYKFLQRKSSDQLLIATAMHTWSDFFLHFQTSLRIVIHNHVIESDSFFWFAFSLPFWFVKLLIISLSVTISSLTRSIRLFSLTVQNPFQPCFLSSFYVFCWNVLRSYVIRIGGYGFTVLDIVCQQ